MIIQPRTLKPGELLEAGTLPAGALVREERPLTVEELQPMRIVAPGRVELEKGEPIPVFCPCSRVYQPPLGSESSRCPKCSRLNLHEEQAVERVEAEGLHD